MAITDSQIQDLINKTNIVYNVVNNTLNTSLSNVLSSVINSQNAIQNRITLAANQERSDVSLVSNQIANTVNTAVGTIYKDINTATGTISTNIQAKINAVSQDIQKKVDSVNAAIGLKLDSVNHDINQVVTAALQPILQEIDKQTTLVTNNLNNSINNANTSIKSATIVTNNLINTVKTDLLNKINTSNATTATITNTPVPPPVTTSGLLGGGNANGFPMTVAEWAKLNGITSPDQQEPIGQSILRFFIGNDAAKGFEMLGAADIPGEILRNITAIGAIEEKALNGHYKTLTELNNDFKQLGVNTGTIGAVLQLPLIIANIGEIFKMFLLPTLTKIEQLLVAGYSLKQLSEGDYLEALIKDNMSAADVKAGLGDLGHAPDDAQLLMQNATPKMDIDTLFRLAHLGKIDDKTLLKFARQLGWTEPDVIRLGYAKQPRPGIQDLITFAVKEVYSPEIYNKFGQYQDFPVTFAEQAKLLGLDEQFAKQYWAAHWALPGANQGFDLFHRGLITHDDLAALLKALDVMPFWREKLIQLSYNIVGRVDARRLYAYGIWDAQKVYQTYLAEGYSPDNARDLTTFTVKYDDEQDNKHKTALQKKAKDVYVKSYIYGLIDKNTASSKIVALGYKQNDVDLELSLELYEEYVNSHKPKKENHVSKLISLSLDGYRKRAISRQDLLANLTGNGYSLSDANTEADYVDKENTIVFKETVVKEIQKLYFESLLDDNGVLTKLVQLGFANSEALNIISQLQILKELDDKKPTPAQFKTMFEDDIISENEYAIELANMGYNAKYIPNIIALSVGSKK